MVRTTNHRDRGHPGGTMTGISEVSWAPSAPAPWASAPAHHRPRCGGCCSCGCERWTAGAARDPAAAEEALRRYCASAGRGRRAPQASRPPSLPKTAERSSLRGRYTWWWQYCNLYYRYYQMGRATFSYNPLGMLTPIAGIDPRRQILTSKVDPAFRRLNMKSWYLPLYNKRPSWAAIIPRPPSRLKYTKATYMSTIYAL